MIKVNLTIEIDEHELPQFESFLNEHLNIIDLRILPETKELFENDKHFQNLVLNYRKAKNAKDEYINRKL